MSALAGILNFGSGGAPVNDHDLANLGEALDARGPDGGSEAVSRNIGMVYRAFHTNRESRVERLHELVAVEIRRDRRMETLGRNEVAQAWASDGELPENSEHSALASEYAHVTAPLRRLGDRYAGEICVAMCAGVDVPGWVLDRLGELPQTLQKADQVSHRYEGAVVDLVEAGVLRDRVGETFAGVIVDVDQKDDKRGTITVQDPAIEARVTGSEPVPLGNAVTATLAQADIGSRTVSFTLSS